MSATHAAESPRQTVKRCQGNTYHRAEVRTPHTMSRILAVLFATFVVVGVAQSAQAGTELPYPHTGPGTNLSGSPLPPGPIHGTHLPSAYPALVKVAGTNLGGSHYPGGTVHGTHLPSKAAKPVSAKLAAVKTAPVAHTARVRASASQPKELAFTGVQMSAEVGTAALLIFGGACLLMVGRKLGQHRATVVT